MPSPFGKGLNSRARSFSPPATAKLFCTCWPGPRPATCSSALGETLAQVQGAFSLLLMTKDSLIGVRDPNGFRPLYIGKLNGLLRTGFGNLRLRSDRCNVRSRGGTRRNRRHPRWRIAIDESAARAKACEVHFRARLFFAARTASCSDAPSRQAAT